MTFCECGSFSPAFAKVNQSHCSDACPGDPEQSCGGLDHYSVAGPGHPALPAYCVTRYSLPDLEVYGDWMTPRKCMEKCAARGRWEFAGMWASDMCYCGSHPPTTALVQETRCDRSCRGDPALVCGGKKEFSVYKLHSRGQEN